jgi:hypothetical protein
MKKKIKSCVMPYGTEYTNFFEDVVRQLSKANNSLLEAAEVIENTELVKKPTKKTLLARIDNMLAESDAIWNKLGQLGKVK